MNRLHQLLKGITALLIAAAVVVGVPAGLTVYVGWPLPTRIPTLEEVQLALRSGIDPQLLINTLAVIVWIVWAQLVAALTVELAAVIKGKTARRAPVLPAIQTTAARLVTTITLIAATLAPLRPDAVLAQPIPTVVVQADRDRPDATPHRPAHQANTPSAVAQEETHRQATYLVRRFDTLWGIAETTLGDGRRWQEIRDLNLGRPTATGEEITTSTDHIPVGTSLILPTDANHPASDEEPASSKGQPEEEVTVEEGDHFWKIAETALRQAWGREPTAGETASYWQLLVDTNRDRLLPPHDPDLIHPGQVFQLPTIPEAPAAAEPTHNTEEITEPAPDDVTVQQGDHFWKIAETALRQAWGREPTTEETATYWRQLIEANRDRLAPPHDPNLIYPGQVFHLPAVSQDPTASEPGPDREDQPDTGNNRQQAETPHPETVTDHPATTAPPTEPTEAADAAGETPEGEQAPSETTMAQETTRAGPETSDIEDQDRQDGLLPTAARLAGLGLLAAGVVALLDRLRRVQVRQRRPGTIPTPPPATAAKTEATLRAAAVPTATELLDLALRALARQLSDSYIPPPQVVGVHLTDEVLRLLLWNPHPDPPPGWQVDDNGHSWVLPTTVDPTHLHLLADGVPAPYPALVTVGHDADAQLLLDLEYLGATQITGEPEDVAATCYTMATELASSPIADMVEVVCVGFGHDLAHLERITTADSLTDVLPAVEQVTAATATQDVTPLEGRLGPGGDSWAPLIILDPNSERPEGAARLLAAAHQGRAVCAVVGYPTGGQWRLHVSQGTIRIDPLGHTYKRRNLTPTEQTHIADLTRAAKGLEGIPEALAELPAVSLKAAEQAEDDTPDTTSPTPTIQTTASQPTLEVRTLGTIRVEGITARFPEPKCLELVTYLVFHRKGVESDTLMEALYPGQPPNKNRLHNLIYEARHPLGVAPDGELHLPHQHDGLYRIGNHVGCDLDRFRQHTQAAGQADATDEAEHLQAALDLVEAAPFSSTKDGYGWAHTEGFITHAIVTVDNTAHRLAQLALQADDPEQATWAARKGLTASWSCEACYRNLMLAAVAQSDQTALDAVYNELIAIVDDEEGADATGWLDPETIELYEKHSRKRRRRRGHGD